MPSRETKSPTAFRTISEVADTMGVPQHVLRFWESKFSQIKPMKRGGGRRYYRPEDVDILGVIRNLLHQDGYTIKGAQKFLREHGVKTILQTIEHNRQAGEDDEASLDISGHKNPLLSGGYEDQIMAITKTKKTGEPSSLRDIRQRLNNIRKKLKAELQG